MATRTFPLTTGSNSTACTYKFLSHYPITLTDNPSRLQQNVGIVVACAPILKPILAKTLKLQTSNATGPSTQAGQYGIRSRTNPNGMGYARDMDDGDFEMARYRGDYIHRGDERDLSTVVKGGSGSDEGSETNILPNYPQDKVLMQTEISIVQT